MFKFFSSTFASWIFKSVANFQRPKRHVALASPPSAASLGSLKKSPKGRVGGVGVGVDRWATAFEAPNAAKHRTQRNTVPDK